MFDLNWSQIFIPQDSILDSVVRGSLIYLLLFVVLRFFMNRQAGAVGIPDILVVVLIVEATTDALGQNDSVTEAAVLIATVIAWSYGLLWLSYRVRWLEFIISSPKVQLIENGMVLRRNMRREMVTDEELDALLRAQGIDDRSAVKAAFIEGSGDISVIPFENTDTKTHLRPDRKL